MGGVLFMSMLLCAVPVLAQTTPPAQTTPANIVQSAHIDQNLGAQIPANLGFTDENGRAVQLGDYFGAKPSLLVLAYFSCPNLCPLTLRHLIEGLNGIGPHAGQDFQVIVVSFDPRDNPAAAQSAKIQYIRGYRRQSNGQPSAGFHFLTGSSAAIQRLTTTVGFNYTFDKQTWQYAHAAGVMVLTPQGQLSHYFFGIDFPPASLEGALKDAQAGHSSWVASPQQQYCFGYDPLANPRTRVVTRVLQVSGAAWVVLLVGYVVLHRGSKQPPAQQPQTSDS